MHFPGGKMQISPKLEHYSANQDRIRNQRPQLSRNILFLGQKAGGCKPVPKVIGYAINNLLLPTNES